MKKSASPKSTKSENTKSKKIQTVAEYLAAVPEPARSTLNKVRATIQSVLPDEAGEVISYGIPGFKYKKLLVWYAAFADHCSLFPTASVIARFKDDLKSYRVSKGTIHFAVDRPLPAALLKKMVNARLSEVAGKERPRK